MTKRELQSEVTRLRADQLKARQEEMILGSSLEDKAEYNARSMRIREVDAELEALGLAEDASASQRHDWNKTAETDTPQSESHQPYRDRERDSSRAFTDSLKIGKSQPATKTEQTD